MLTQERLNIININTERNDKMFIVEKIGFIEKRSGLVRDSGDTIYGQYNTLEEAKQALERASKHAQMEYDYYEVFIAQAFSYSEEEDSDIGYDQLEEFTIKTCEPSYNKMEANYSSL